MQGTVFHCSSADIRRTRSKYINDSKSSQTSVGKTSSRQWRRLPVGKAEWLESYQNNARVWRKDAPLLQQLHVWQSSILLHVFKCTLNFRFRRTQIENRRHAKVMDWRIFSKRFKTRPTVLRSPLVPSSETSLSARQHIFMRTEQRTVSPQCGQPPWLILAARCSANLPGLWLCMALTKTINEGHADSIALRTVGSSLGQINFETNERTSQMTREWKKSQVSRQRVLHVLGRFQYGT